LGNRQDQIDDKIDVLSRGMLGLTAACARCHDHKFEPITTADYYALYGVFNSTAEPDDEARRRMLLADVPNPGNAHIFLRGNPSNQGEKVPRQFFAVLTKGQPQPFTDGSGRRELAEKVAARDNPLTARVWVNRVWGHLLGAPLVATPSDFGVRTAAPRQLDLLDHLADRFMAEGWSLKNLHRWIVLSSTYQQASNDRPIAAGWTLSNFATRSCWQANRWTSPLAGPASKLPRRPIRIAAPFMVESIDRTCPVCIAPLTSPIPTAIRPVVFKPRYRSRACS
jgi:hypothetical protein